VEVSDALESMMCSCIHYIDRSFPYSADAHKAFEKVHGKFENSSDGSFKKRLPLFYSRLSSSELYFLKGELTGFESDNYRRKSSIYLSRARLQMVEPV
jgi:hypothetical protein